MFTSDDLVVYPAQGVGKIERIDSKTVGGIVCELYIVRIRANNVTLMVPVNNAAHVGLRTLTPGTKHSPFLNRCVTNLARQYILAKTGIVVFVNIPSALKAPAWP